MKRRGVVLPTPTGQDLADFIAYLHSVHYFDPGAGDVARGREFLSSKGCLGCHSVYGRVGQDRQRPGKVQRRRLARGPGGGDVEPRAIHGDCGAAAAHHAAHADRPGAGRHHDLLSRARAGAPRNLAEGGADPFRLRGAQPIDLGAAACARPLPAAPGSAFPQVIAWFDHGCMLPRADVEASMRCFAEHAHIEGFVVQRMVVRGAYSPRLSVRRSSRAVSSPSHAGTGMCPACRKCPRV